MLQSSAILPTSQAGPLTAGKPSTSGWPPSGVRNGKPGAVNKASVRGDELHLDDQRFSCSMRRVSSRFKRRERFLLIIESMRSGKLGVGRTTHALRKSRPARCMNCTAHDREPGHTMCKRCLEGMRRGQAERRKRWRAAGMCIYCGRPRHLAFSSCAHCRKEKQERRRKARPTQHR